MARLIVRTALHSRRVLLTSSTLIGRHWSCGVVLQEPSVPLFWLELRWAGSRWVWRCLEAEDDTVGAGAVLDARWRVLQKDGVVRLPRASVSLALAQPGPPRMLLENLRTGEMVEGDDCLYVLEVTDAGVFRHNGDGLEQVADGEVFVEDGQAFRVHLPSCWANTEAAQVSLSTEGVAIEWNSTFDRVELTVGRRSVVVVGEPARLLCVYAMARRGGDGWMTNAKALGVFVSLGGSSVEDPRRMNWERSRLRQRLREAGANGVDQLFAKRRVEGLTEHRLELDWVFPKPIATT